MTADRPATEPRTEAKQRLWEYVCDIRGMGDNGELDEMMDAIEAEAAQGAAPRAEGLLDGGRWSRDGWHWLACWEQWSHDPERECVCDRLRQAATVQACSDHDENGPTDEASGFPTCSKCSAILSEGAGPQAEGACEICRKPGHDAESCPAAEWGDLSGRSQEPGSGEPSSDDREAVGRSDLNPQTEDGAAEAAGVRTAVGDWGSRRGLADEGHKAADRESASPAEGSARKTPIVAAPRAEGPPEGHVIGDRFVSDESFDAAIPAPPIPTREQVHLDPDTDATDAFIGGFRNGWHSRGLSQGAAPRAEGLDVAIEAIEDVLTGMDWLGTGSSMKVADEEEREAWQQWDVILTALGRPGNSHARVYGETHDD